MQDFKKIIRLGETKDGNVFCRIKWQNGKLSISGVIGPKKNGDATGSAGQIDMDLTPDDFTSFAPTFDAGEVEQFLAIWKQYHLNDMQAGCEHQREAGWTHRDVGHACPVCGYRYGSAWLHKDIPEHVQEYLYNLPDTDKEPAWI